MDIEYDNLLPLTDLALIGYLVSLFPVKKIDSTDTKRIIFFFEDSQNLQEAIDGFWNGTVTISPLEYFTNIKNLKTRIHTER